MIVNRRDVLLMCASLGTAVFPPLADSQVTLPDGALRSYMRMRGLGTLPVAIGCLEGIYNGVVDGVVTPAVGVISATFADYKEVESGFEIRSSELAYFTDLDSGAVLDSWHNPYTNEVVPVSASELAPTTTRIGASLLIDSEAALPPGLQLRHSVAAPQILGREVWFTETVMVRREARVSEPAFHYNESTVLRARLTDLSQSNALPVRCDTSYQSVSSWRTWMKMATHPGGVVGFGNGFYGTSIDELPPAWIKATERYRPEILRDPAKMLQTKSPQVR